MKNYFLFIFLVLTQIAFADDYKISSAKELASLKLKPGDKVILNAGEWKDQQLVFTGIGTENLPIILTTEKPGEVKLTGNSSLKIDGEWLIINGIYFTDGFSNKDDVIRFSEKSLNCRLTNSAVVNFNNKNKKLDYKWVSIYGHHNRVDHCWLEGKIHQGATLVVWLDSTANYDLIDHNYFGKRPDLNANGGESIRIGTSNWSMFDSYTTVEKNIFEYCNGEIEIISSKSCKNIIRDNLFFESEGTLTLRHGNGADVYGNYFIGNGLDDIGGIRVIAENHKVHDNYFQGLTGTGIMAAISIMDGESKPELSGYWQVKNVNIYNNTIINCKESLSIGAGKNATRNLKPQSTSFSNNIISTKDRAIHWADDSAELNFDNNIIWLAADADEQPSGFIKKDPQLQRDSNNLYFEKNKNAADPFWKKEDIGPSWMEKKPVISVKP